MTPVPVVSTPLNTRTVRRCEHSAHSWFPCEDAVERLVADPAFVVLPEVPDLNGSPVYAATWQCRATGQQTESPWGRCSIGEGENRYHDWFKERRQLVEWRARRVEPLPVVDFATTTWPETEVVGIDFEGCPGVWKPIGSASHELHLTLASRPWAADLKPGMCVLRLSDFERLSEPIVLDAPVEPGEIRTVEL